jgi:uncharacterized lipoprotein YmbA
MIGAVGAVTLCACASQADHFYALTSLPDAPLSVINPTSRPVRLRLTVPSLVDRSELVLNDAGNDVLIYDHERWAAPLADQIASTLARDLEARRDDLFFGDSRFDRSGTPPLRLNVDIVQVIARRSDARGGAGVSIVAHWHIAGAGKDGANGAAPGGATADQLGGGSFTAPFEGDGFAAVARGYSQVLSRLADALAAAIPATDAAATQGAPAPQGAATPRSTLR